VRLKSPARWVVETDRGKSQASDARPRQHQPIAPPMTFLRQANVE